MKRFVYLAVLCFSIVFMNLSAQEQETGSVKADTMQFTDDELTGYEVDTVSTATPSKVYKTISAGYKGTFVMHKLDDFNKFIGSDLYSLPELNTPIYLSGFNFNIALEETKNFIIGFTYSAGSKTVDKSLTGDLKDYKLSANYRISYTGIELNYAIMPFESFVISPGVSFGLSNLKLHLYQNKDKYDFDKGLIDANSYDHTLEGSFYYAEPHINIQYRISQYFLVNFGVGYSVGFAPDWKINSEGTLENMPSGIKPEGLNFNFGINLGFFDF